MQHISRVSLNQRATHAKLLLIKTWHIYVIYSNVSAVGINNGCSSRHVPHGFVVYRFEASSLHFGRRHLVFLEPEVTIFGTDGESCDS